MSFELKLCRICLKQDEDINFLDIFANGDEIAEKIYLISAVQIHKYEIYSSFICESCLDQLNEAIELRERCLKADEYFQSLFLHNSEVEYIEEIYCKTEIVSDEDTFNPSDIIGNEEAIDPSERSIKKTKAFRLKTEKYECTKCSKSFSCQSYLQKHDYVKHTEVKSEDYFECDNCSYRSKTKTLIKAHMLNNHISSGSKAAKTYICKVCGKIYRSAGALYGHEKTHEEIPKEQYLKCDKCDKSFKEKRFLKSHIQLVHDKSQMKQCSDCEFIATCPGGLNRHRKAVHLKLRNHICDKCNQGFARNQQLLRHYRTHTGDKPYSCLNEACKKVFAQPHGRKRHMKICKFSKNKSGDS